MKRVALILMAMAPLSTPASGASGNVPPGADPRR